MNKQQQQNAMLKLATVRLAINHVLRSRAMQKRAEGAPRFGDPEYIAPEYEYLTRLQDALLGSPNFADTHVENSYGAGSNQLAGPKDYSDRTELMSPTELARGLSRPLWDPGYLPPSKLDELLPHYYSMYNGENAGVDLMPYVRDSNKPGGNKDGIYQQNSLPAWGIPEIMNAGSPGERFRAGQNYLLKQKAPLRRHLGDAPTETVEAK